MAFLAPLFLLGMAALAIPVLIHLVERERGQVVQFPSLMFLRRIPYKSMRLQRIRHWLLLLLRCAALLLLVMAFARPFFRSPALAAGVSSAAREAVEALGPDDRATVIFFARGAQAGARSTVNRASLLASITAAEVSVQVTRYGPALKLAQTILEASELAGSEVIMISDFQKTGWDASEGARFPDGTVLTPMSLADPTGANVAVSAVSFEQEFFSGLERVSASARLANTGDNPVRDLEVTLEIAGREIESQLVSLEPSASATVTFAPFTLSDPDTRGTIRAAGDDLPQDDMFHFIVSPGQAVSVLIIGRADAAFYLSQALAIGSAPTFRPEVISVEQVTAADLDGRSVIVINDVRPPRGGTGQRLKDLRRERRRPARGARRAKFLAGRRPRPAAGFLRRAGEPVRQPGRHARLYRLQSSGVRALQRPTQRGPVVRPGLPLPHARDPGVRPGARPLQWWLSGPGGAASRARQGAPLDLHVG